MFFRVPMRQPTPIDAVKKPYLDVVVEYHQSGFLEREIRLFNKVFQYIRTFLYLRRSEIPFEPNLCYPFDGIGMHPPKSNTPFRAFYRYYRHRVLHDVHVLYPLFKGGLFHIAFFLNFSENAFFCSCVILAKYLFFASLIFLLVSSDLGFLIFNFVSSDFGFRNFIFTSSERVQ